jgi:hypothetical protein
LLLDQILATWKDYATVKKWKKSLKFDSNEGRLSSKTDEAGNYYMPLFIEFKQKTPDAIIEEALAGKFVVKESLSDFCNWLEDEKNMKRNHAIHAAYEIIRGFYSHNDINTQKIRTPTKDPSEVQTTDDVLPLFEIVETVHEDGKKEKVKKIRRGLLTKFLDLLPFRDKVIMMCIKDTGADDGDILRWTLGNIRYQEPGQERIFIRLNRQKTRRFVCYFLSKETTKMVRRYEKLYREFASDDEPIFVQSETQFKAQFFREHGRPFMKERDEMHLKVISTHTLSDSCRNAAKKLEKILKDEGNPTQILRRYSQSPLRPKRFRKVFSDACDYVGIATDVKRLFMGKKEDSNQPYGGKSRQDLELYFDKLEPVITIYSDPEPIASPEIQKLRNDLKRLEEKYEQDREKWVEDSVKRVLENWQLKGDCGPPNVNKVNKDNTEPI